MCAVDMAFYLFCVQHHQFLQFVTIQSVVNEWYNCGYALVDSVDWWSASSDFLLHIDSTITCPKLTSIAVFLHKVMKSCFASFPLSFDATSNYRCNNLSGLHV